MKGIRISTKEDLKGTIGTTSTVGQRKRFQQIVPKCLETLCQHIVLLMQIWRATLSPGEVRPVSWYSAIGVSVIWHSKRQNLVEPITFNSEIMALKSAIELIEALRYKLRMFGFPIEGPTNIFCNNEAVYKNYSIPESTLRKKHHSIAYHRNREAVADMTCRIAKEDTKTNLSDLFTKILPCVTREELLDRFMYYESNRGDLFLKRVTPCSHLKLEWQNIFVTIGKSLRVPLEESSEIAADSRRTS